MGKMGFAFRLVLLGLAFLALSLNCGVDDMSDFERAFATKRASDLSSRQSVPPNPTFGLKGEYVKFLRLDTDDQKSLPVTINLRAEYTLSNPLVSPDGHNVSAPNASGVPQTGGPLVARVRWGTGGTWQVVDFDVPEARGVNNLSGTGVSRAPVDDIGGGVSLELSGSAFEVTVRNDGNLLPIVGGTVSVSGQTIVSTNQASVMAFVAPGEGATSSPLWRMVRVCVPGAPQTPLASGATSPFFEIPTFARTLWLPRTTIDVTPITVNTFDNSGLTIRTVNVPVNSEGPITLFSQEQVVTFTNLGGNPLTSLAALFDVNPS